MKRSLFDSDALKRDTLRRFLAVSALSVCLAFVLLAAGWLISVSWSRDTKQKLFVDAQSQSVSYQLELAVREAEASQRSGDLPTSEARRVLAQIPCFSTSTDENALVQTLTERFGEWERGGALSPLLQSIDEHRALNEAQMRDSMLQSARLENTLRWTVPSLLLGALGALGWGVWRGWSRVFEPTLKLSSAAEEFGQGAMWSRAPVRRDDEIGELCRTFNTMADAIVDREAERLRFVATVAHDLKNPLMVVGMASQLMRRKQLPPEQFDHWLERIGNNARQMEGIIADLTDGVQAQTGRLELQREEMDLAQLAADVVRQQRESLECQAPQKASAPTHTLRFEGEQACPILGDCRRLERVLVNLISNAVKYSPRGSEVRVGVWRRGEMARLTVEDQGEGIAPEDLERLFQPFARLQSTRHMASGTGLGLVSTQKIIHAHGGNIRIFSPPQRGTTVEIGLHLRPQRDTKEPL